MAVTVLVTGAGGPAGVAVIRALQDAGQRVVAADADSTAVGLRMADTSAVIPMATEPDFATALCELAQVTGATALVCTVAEEMRTLWESASLLDDVGLAHWLPNADAVEVCLDKWRFATACRRHGVAVPPTALGRPDALPGPWIVKPRFGRGSRDVYPVDPGEDFAWPLRRVAHPLWQTRLTGREFTVDVLVSRDGSLVGAVPRWRTETKAGISTKGCTFADPSLLARVDHLVTALGLRGVANVQGFLTDAGLPVFVEVNPRFSGGLPLSLAAGADLVGQYLRGVLGQPIYPEKLRFRAGVAMTRRYHEIFESAPVPVRASAGISVGPGRA